jgi:hypothetical protein
MRHTRGSTLKERMGGARTGAMQGGGYWGGGSQSDLDIGVELVRCGASHGCALRRHGLCTHEQHKTQRQKKNTKREKKKHKTNRHAA